MTKKNKPEPLALKDEGLTWTELHPLIRATLESDISVLILGHPGVGKSTLAKSLANSMGLELIDIRLAQKDPAELGGVYFPDKDSHSLKLLPPEWVLKACSKPCFVFLDEINSGVSKLHQAVAYQIVLEKKVANFVFHPKTVVMAAGNLLDDNAIVSPLSSALANRFAHFRLRVDAKCWVDWGMGSLDWRILSYISCMGDEALYCNSGDSDAFPSPRTWAMTSSILEKNPDINIRRVASSCVGSAAATAFASWIELNAKLDPETVIMDGKMVDFTSGKKRDPSFKYAAIFSVGNWAASNEEKISDQHMENLVHFANSDGLDPEYQFLLVRRMCQNKSLMEKLKKLKSFQKLSTALVSIRSELFQ